MAVSLNKTGSKYAKSLIERGKVCRDVALKVSDADIPQLLGSDGSDWGLFEKFHLGLCSDASEKTKERFDYVFGKAGTVYLQNVIEAKDRAVENGDSEVADFADELLRAITETHVDSVKVTRGDYFDWRDWQTEKMQKTPDGQRMIGRAVITNTGVFRYPQADGSVWLELRHPDDVFEEASLRSLDGVTLTDDHPSVGVSADNYKFLTVGSVTSPSHDAYHVTAKLSINEKQAIADVQAGKRALSCGYDCELVAETGVYLGMPYTHRQKKIRYNHVAIVDVGRAGDAAKLRMDSVQIHQPTKPSKEKLMKIRLDHSAGGAEAEVESAVATEFGALTNLVKSTKDSLDTANSELATAKSALDTAEGKLAVVEAEKVELTTKLASAMDAAAVEAAVTSRVELIDAAKAVGVKVETNWDSRKIKESVVALAFPTISLDGKSSEFVDATFEASKASIAARNPVKPAGAPGGTSHNADNLDSLLRDAKSKALTAVQTAYIGAGKE